MFLVILFVYNLQPDHQFATIPNWDDFDFDALNEDEDVLDDLGEASLNLHRTNPNGACQFIVGG